METMFRARRTLAISTACSELLCHQTWSMVALRLSDCVTSASAASTTWPRCRKTCKRWLPTLLIPCGTLTRCMAVKMLLRHGTTMATPASILTCRVISICQRWAAPSVRVAKLLSISQRLPRANTNRCSSRPQSTMCKWTKPRSSRSSTCCHRRSRWTCSSCLTWETSRTPS